MEPPATDTMPRMYLGSALPCEAKRGIFCNFGTMNAMTANMTTDAIKPILFCVIHVFHHGVDDPGGADTVPSGPPMGGGSFIGGVYAIGWRWNMDGDMG